MKLSQRGRYGVLALHDLANEYGKGPVALKSIAERQDISENYLEQLMGTLRKAGFIKSIRGAQGGYMLAKGRRKSPSARLLWLWKALLPLPTAC